MVAEVTYLELSEDSGGSHKFYEVTVDGTEVYIRYGRIGDHGQSQSKTYPTIEKAQAEAQKKIKEKQRKGYEAAVMEARKKRPVTHRTVTSTESKAVKAPILWKFNSNSPAFGIFIEAEYCWIANQAGRVYKLNHQGEILNQFQLPEGVKCLVTDDVWVYAGCDDGNVYDLSGKIPRLAYSIDEKIDIYWLDIYDGILAVSDANGAVVKIDPEQDFQWTRLSGGKFGWMVRCDAEGIYHGHSSGVTMYDLEAGRQIWHNQMDGGVLFGWQEKEFVYAGTFSKKFTASVKTVKAKPLTSVMPLFTPALPPHKVNTFLPVIVPLPYTALVPMEIDCETGNRLRFSIVNAILGRSLYLVTTEGYLACMDATETAIQSAQNGQLPETVTLQTPLSSCPTTISTALETTSDTQVGVIVECIQQGNQLRIRVVSPGYNPDWFVQFPKNLREEGVRYLVQEIRESARGGFYRVYGEIKKLIA